MHLSTGETTRILCYRLFKHFHGKWEVDSKQHKTLNHKVRAKTPIGVSTTFNNAKMFFHYFTMPRQLGGQHQSCACVLQPNAPRA